MTGPNSYRKVPLGQSSPQAVTIGIEAGADGQPKAAVWWEAKGDLDACEAEYSDVADGFRAAEAAKELHGIDEIVVALADSTLWRTEWGMLVDNERENKPTGAISTPGLSADEASELASAIEMERDA